MLQVRLRGPDGIESGEHVAICLVNDQLDMLSQRLAHNGTTGPVPAGWAVVPIGVAATARPGSDATVVTYGVGVPWALEAAATLADVRRVDTWARMHAAGLARELELEV